VKSLEDNPVFNAGYGSVLTEDGTVEMDAMIMDGKTLNTGTIIVHYSSSGLILIVPSTAIFDE